MSAQNKAPSRLSTALLALITTKQLLTVVVTALVTGAVILGVSGLFQGEPAQSESGAVKLGFEDIGELATQSAYCTQVSVTQADRELFGISIPFTQSKYIYSYNVEIQAGFDFGEITYTVDEESGTIRVQLPAPRVLSSEIDLDSFQLYHEEESIFRKITLPLLAPTFLFVSTIALTNSFKLVDHVVIMTEGAPNNASTLLLYYIYQQGFTNFNYGVSSALTTVMLVLLMIVALPRFLSQDKKIHYN